MTRSTKLNTLAEVNRALRDAASVEIAAHSKRFFKAGPGEYGEGDRFHGIRVPVVRRLAQQARELPLGKVRRLLDSPYHEARLMALILLAEHYGRGDTTCREEIYLFYLASTRKINNWDLVDASAHKIVGRHLESRSRKPLDKLAASKLLWDRRVAIIATYHFIQQGETETTFRLARKLRDDPHDLIHKAVGWMLREAGKKQNEVLLRFLDRHARRMPRTMLCYAMEKLTPAQRRKFMAR